MLVTPSRNELVEPEVVATSPNRIKSPVPVYCGFSSEKMVGERGLAQDLHLQGSQTLDLRGLLFPLNHSPEKYSNWSLQPVLPRHDFFTKEIHRLLQGGRKWSQSPVLPWAQRAYDARLSAGSTAVLPHGHKTGAPTRSCIELASIPKKCIAQNALGALKLASLTGFAPVISCMRGRHVVWTTPQGRNQLMNQ